MSSVKAAKLVYADGASEEVQVFESHICIKGKRYGVSQEPERIRICLTGETGEVFALKGKETQGVMASLAQAAARGGFALGHVWLISDGVAILNRHFLPEEPSGLLKILQLPEVQRILYRNV